MLKTFTFQAYTFVFAYLTLPLVVYITFLLAKKVHSSILNLESLCLKSPSFTKRLITILAFDLLILVVLLIIPAGIVHQIEPDMDFGMSFWYLFATTTTIGFGDVIAGIEHQDEFYHQHNFFWVSKMGFMLVALSFMMADLFLKHETIVEFFYSPSEKMFGKKHLLDNEISADTIEVTDINRGIHQSSVSNNPFDN